jgi:hypothetical protein
VGRLLAIDRGGKVIQKLEHRGSSTDVLEVRVQGHLQLHVWSVGIRAGLGPWHRFRLGPWFWSGLRPGLELLVDWPSQPERSRSDTDLARLGDYPLGPIVAYETKRAVDHGLEDGALQVCIATREERHPRRAPEEVSHLIQGAGVVGVDQVVQERLRRELADADRLAELLELRPDDAAIEG